MYDLKRRMMTASTFKTLFLPLSAGMYRTAYALLGNPQDAEDAVQEAFIRLWQRRDRVPVDEDLDAYCRMLVRNLCIDLLRKGRLPEAEATVEDVLVADAQSALSALEGKEAVAEVEEAIHQLPENQQRVVELHVLHDRSLNEIEQATGFSAVNVRVLLSRGKRKLQQLLRR
ncbi:MAG: sigma-70 family RNA polymerase sigma factor [Bacteroidaceae bacterium]|nr:sigma-70 family RNA polymerase sigma factor [Bacteroidaceae bacterium]